MNKYNRYNYSVNTYNKSGNIEIPALTNGITVTNTGDTICTVNGMVLYPGTPGTSLGDSRSIGGNENEILYSKLLNISFTPGGTSPNVEVIIKYYII